LPLVLSLAGTLLRNRLQPDAGCETHPDTLDSEVTKKERAAVLNHRTTRVRNGGVK